MTALIEHVRNAVIGDKHGVITPFGERPLVYADYTASGKSLDFIERYIQQQVLPYYANTHTETSFTGAQTTALREQARQQIRAAVNGDEDDLVIFCGSGSTSAIDKLIGILNLRLPKDLCQRYQMADQIPQKERPVVFVGPYEHHSNELPWRESIADVVVIPLNELGQLDVEELDNKLKQFAERPLKIGSFSAASNVTGIKTDVVQVTALLKARGALAFWDYAAAAPYVGINVNADAPIDAVFISPHKFVGGPGTPGVLVVKRSVLNNSVPAVVGGGTVAYVTPEDHRFVDDYERREEAGTPAIVESIRAGLVFKLQQQVGTPEIERRENDFVKRAMARLSRMRNVEILGGVDVPRISIFSLRFKHGERYLHYGFVVSLLSDLFGIQVRGGCSCAGPYGHALLGMDMAYSKAIEDEIQCGGMVLRPGWVRLNFNYFIDEAEFDFLLHAIELVAEHGWRLLPYYNFDRTDGVWRFNNEEVELPSSLDALEFADIAELVDSGSGQTKPLSYEHVLAEAERELTASREGENTFELQLSEQGEQLRWFALPQEVLQELQLEECHAGR